MKGHFLMRQEQRDRIDVLKSVRKKVMRLKEAGVVLGISYRQCRRIYRRYLDEGESGLIHRLVGRPSNRSIDPGPREAILERYRQRYPDFGPTLAAEKLNLDGYKRIDHETLRQWLVKEGLWHKRRKRPGHRTWRQRRAHFGELVQMDGSIHRWFEGRADGDYCLMNMVDDATGVTMSLFDKEETTACAMMLLWEWIECYGIPAALYTDHKNVYVPSEKSNLRAQERGTVVLTQFGRACQKLGARFGMKAYH